MSDFPNFDAYFEPRSAPWVNFHEQGCDCDHCNPGLAPARATNDELEAAVEGALNELFAKFNDIACKAGADTDEICTIVSEYGGDELASIYHEWVEENIVDAEVVDEPDPDAARDRAIADELEKDY